MESIIAGKYKITAELGRGGMGMVYKAKHKSLGREDALKVLHPALSRDREFLQRFSREAQAMARLDHLNIVRVYDSFEFEQKYFIAMEYFEGYSLASILENNKPLSVSQVLSIISQATSGLAYAHARGIIHRDIKPENMMVSNNFRVKLTDFGIATANNEYLESINGQVMGSPCYMSPEQACGREIDNRSDLYSLGIVFYQLITRTIPCQGDSGVDIIQKLAEEIEELTLEFESDVPLKVQRIIRTLLQRDPNKRYPNASALQIEIAEAMGSEKNQQVGDSMAADIPAAAQAQTPLAPPLAAPRSRSTLWILLLMLFLVSGAYGYVSQKTILTQVMSLLDFRPAQVIAEENTKLEIERMHVHLLDHENAASEARKKVDEESLTAEAKKIFDEAVKVQINGTTELTEAVGHIARAEYKEAQIIMLTAEAFFEEAETQFLLASEAVEKASRLNIVEGLMEEATLLKNEVTISKQKAVSTKAKDRKISEFQRGVFYHDKADRLFKKSQQLIDENKRLKSRVSIDEAIDAYVSAKTYFAEAQKISQKKNYEDGVEAGLTELSKLRLIITTTKIDAQHLGAATKASALFEKANALNKELMMTEKHINSLLDKGENRRAVNRLENAKKLASEVESAYLKAARASEKVTSQATIKATSSE